MKMGIICRYNSYLYTLLWYNINDFVLLWRYPQYSHIFRRIRLMKHRIFLIALYLFVIMAMLLSACAPAATPAPTEKPAEKPTAAAAVEKPTEASAPAGTLPDLKGREVTVAIENAYPPFNYVDAKTAKPGGWDYETWDEICKRLNCKPVYKEAAWEGMIQAVADKQFDAAADGITNTPDRAKIVDFSVGYIKTEQRLLVRLGEKRFTSIEDIVKNKDFKLGTQTGTTNYETAIKYLPEDRIKAFEQFPFAVQALIANDIDAVIIDAYAGVGYTGENKEKVELVGPSISSDELAFIFSKGSDLVAPINAALDSMKADGALEKLNLKFFGPNFVAPEAPAAPAAAPAVEGGELKVGLEADIASLDPAFNYDFSTGPVDSNICENLLKFDADGKAVPSLAEKIEAKDPQTYVFTIRKGVTFQDGSPMTIDDVIFSLERTKNPDVAAYVGWMLGDVDKIEKVDEQTLKITLKVPDSTFPYKVATTAGAVISKAYFEAHKDSFGKPDGGVMCTGPFKYVSWTSGNEIILEKNANYWDKPNGGPYVDRIVFKILSEATTRIAALQTNELDIILMKIPGDQVPVAQKIDTINLTTSDGFCIDAAEFNVQRKPWDNAKLRQAINYAVDKAGVTKNLLGDTAMVGKASAVMPSLWSFEKDTWQAAWDKVPAYEKDLDKAKKLLEESGVKPEDINGKEIMVDDNPTRMGQALAIQAAVAELGLKLEIKKVTPQELNSATFGAAREYDISVQNWCADYADPAANLVPLFHSKNAGDGGANYANYKNPEVDKLLDEQSKVIDTAKRTELMIQAQALIAEDSPWIVFDYPKIPMALSKTFTGFSINPSWSWQSFAKDITKVQ